MVNGDILERPLYQIADAAKLAGTTASALKRWSSSYEVPRSYTHAKTERPLIIASPGDDGGLFSFLNLMEARFIVVYRRSGVPLRSIQVAVEFSRRQFEDLHPLRSRRFETDGCHLFARVEEETGVQGLVAFSAAGQLAWPSVVREFFESVEYDEANRPLRWWPQGRSHAIIVDPRFAFGYPVVSGKFVRTDVLAERFQAGEAIDSIALDFGLETASVEEAVRYELTLMAA